MFSHYSLLGTRDSVVNVATRLWAAWSRAQTPAGGKDFSLLQNIQMSSRAHPPAIHLMGGGCVEWLHLEADRYLPSSVEVKNGCSYSPFHHFRRSACISCFLLVILVFNFNILTLQYKEFKQSEDSFISLPCGVICSQRGRSSSSTSAVTSLLYLP
jgi:hypothetical protein